MANFRSSLLLAVASLAAPLVHAQVDFKLFGRPVQVHSFASQGFAYSNNNNYLTMKTSQGSAALTDFGANISMQITDRFRVGAQIYDRNIGNLGRWRPQVDWAFGDYRFKDWFGVRAGIVKTTFGLHNDTQDMEFLHTNALLPQSIYPADLRDALIRHTGADIYGDISLKQAGTLSYTVFAGQRRDGMYGGYLYLLQDRKIYMDSYGGLQYGADLRWLTPLKGFLVGAAAMKENITGTGSGTCSAAVPINCQEWLKVANPSLVGVTGVPASGTYSERSHKDQTRQFYGQYTLGKFRLDAEHRRYVRVQDVWNGFYQVFADTYGWYVSGNYRLAKRVELGSYFSELSTVYRRGALPAVLDRSGPAGHIRDKVITARFDVNRHWNVKVEGHFMQGYNNNQYPGGFYTPDNPGGFKPNTNMLVLRTGWNF